jgi:uncharacterized protein YpmB
MFEIIIVILLCVVSAVIGAHFYGPILNMSGYVSDQIAALLKKKDAP